MPPESSVSPSQDAIEVAARANRSLDALHAMVYFAPEADEELGRVGLRPGRMTYFAGRSAPMGPVSAGVVTATFYHFNPELVARHIPRAWGLASVEAILRARLEAADRALRRLLGDEAASSPAVMEAAELAREATVGLPPEGRALFAANALLDWPTEPHLVLWQAITLLREFRGDGHICALLGANLSGLHALITHTATGRGFTVAAAKATRGWSDEQWELGAGELCAQDLMDEHGLTAEGERLRADIERHTDVLAAAPWERLGKDRTDRLIELGRALSRQITTSGAFPQGVFAGR